LDLSGWLREVGQEIIFDGISTEADTKSLYHAGDRLMVSYGQDGEGQPVFYLRDYVRQSSLYVLVLIFLSLIVLIGRWQGLRSILGLGFSFLIIVKFIIPGIVAGHDPLLVSLGYSLVIVLVATYLTYGFNKKSPISISGMFVGLAATGVLSVLFAQFSHLTGFAQEETMFIVNLAGGAIDLKKLLIAGFIIGTIGVLDDLSVGQASAVQELAQTNPSLSRAEIYRRGMRVGVDHISSMVNTLFLAYAGASLPLLLLFTLK
jgi:uncharacterized membrane protein